jgi:acetyl-CoA C-acetyltransferase
VWIISGVQDIVIAGGVESMTRVPMLSSTLLADEKGMGGPISPGLLRQRPGFAPTQFAGAEMIGQKYGFAKDDADAFALTSHQKAISAIRSGRFNDEILPIASLSADGTAELHRIDEGVRFDVSMEAIRGVKLLQADGIITAATSSQICDGASAVMVVSERIMREYDLKPLARIHDMTVFGDDPSVMLEGPIPATKIALKRAGLTIDQIDLYEVNEAFATVPLAWVKALNADPSRLNVNGGAIALGHPLGASGTKLAATLMHALRDQKKRFGLQTMCEGGGLANVTIYEAL